MLKVYHGDKQNRLDPASLLMLLHWMVKAGKLTQLRTDDPHLFPPEMFTDILKCDPTDIRICIITSDSTHLHSQARKPCTCLDITLLFPCYFQKMPHCYPVITETILLEEIHMFHMFCKTAQTMFMQNVKTNGNTFNTDRHRSVV